VAAVFFTNGALFANIVPRYPELKSSLGLTNAAFGSAVAAFPLGALLAGLSAAVLIRRFRSANVASLGIVVLAAVLVLVSAARNWLVLAAVLFAAGGLDAIVDVAQNAHGLRVQRLYGRSIVNSFHGVWSIGGVSGGAMGAAAAASGLPLPFHLTASFVLFGASALVARRFLLPGPEDAERTVEAQDLAAFEGHAASPLPAHGRVAPGRGMVSTLAALGVLAACGALVEDAAASWGALYLRALGAGVGAAGLAFVVFQGAMTIGRLLGDRFVDRFGQARVVRIGGALAAAAMGVGLAVPSRTTALAGYALAGFGVATLVPAAMHTADELPGLSAGSGLTVVSWLLRVGFLVSPPVVGLVADATSLRVGLLTVVLAGSLVVAFGRVLTVHAPPAAISRAPT
jgi:MFS family permease